MWSESFASAHVINSFETFICNWVDLSKNEIINLWRKKEIKCSDADLKKQTEIDKLSLLAV